MKAQLAAATVLVVSAWAVLGPMAELGAQSRLGPQRELAFEIGLSLEEDRRARGADRFLGR